MNNGDAPHSRTQLLAKLLRWYDAGSAREHAGAITQLATYHALSVKHDRTGAGLTDYGLASCAAACAQVLANERHPNHHIVLDRLRAEAAQEAVVPRLRGQDVDQDRYDDTIDLHPPHR